MRIEIVGKKYDIGKNLEELIVKKVEKQIARYFKDNDVCRVVCKEEHGKFKMEMTIVVGDTVLRAENSASVMYDNIDVVVPKIERQMRKLRTKYKKNFRDTIEVETEAHEEAIEAPAQEAEENDLHIVRTKRYSLRPMSIEDAVFALDMVNHSFFVFENADTKEVNIVYKRYDGGLGIIEVAND